MLPFILAQCFSFLHISHLLTIYQQSPSNNTRGSDLETEINGTERTWKEHQDVAKDEGWCELVEDLCLNGG